MFVVVRTADDPLAQVNAIRTKILALDPGLPVPAFSTLDQVVTDSLDRPRFFTGLLGLFSAVALALATVGIFGLLSFAVARRRREIGFRISLGASPATLMAMILRQALALVVMGLGLGLLGALALPRILESELFGVTAGDPAALAGVTGVLAATAFLATVVPAWRAATVDPLTAIRSE
jgi:ABC-type antimicrobial peptide transport system permease subunit